MPNAIPSESNPGPRLALDAGTRAVTDNPARSVLVITWLSRAVNSGLLEFGGDRGRVHRNRLDLRPSQQRGIGVLEPVAGNGAHHGEPGIEPALLAGGEQTGDAGRRRGFDEHALGRCDQPVGRQDLLVGGRAEGATGLLLGLDRAVPRGRGADPDGGGDGLRVLHRGTVDQRGRTGGLHAEHARQRAGDAVGLVFAVTAPVGGDVAGITDQIGRASGRGRVWVWWGRGGW